MLHEVKKDFLSATIKPAGTNLIIAINSLPEYHRICLASKTFPTVVVLGDTVHVDGVALGDVEMLFLTSMFPGGGFDFKSMSVVRPMILVGAERRVKATMKALRHAFHGLTREELHRLGLKDNIVEMLAKEGEYFRPKNKDGVLIPFEDFVKAVPFRNDEARIDGALIAHVGHDQYLITSNEGGASEVVALEKIGNLRPSWPIPRIAGIEVPHAFRLSVLGSDSPFGKGPTTTFLIDVNGEFLLWDCGDYATLTLKENGIPLSRVSHVIVSHDHKDHCGDLPALALNPYRKITIITTQEIKYSVITRLAAILDVDEGRAERMFHWDVVKPGKAYWFRDCRFDLHYGAHPIPSIGARIFRGKELLAVISGDTGNKTVLAKMVESGAMTTARMGYLLGALVTDNGQPVIVDVGEAGIHGFPVDIIDLEAVKLSHRGTLPDHLKHAATLVKPGETFVSIGQMTHSFDAVLITQTLERLGVKDAAAWARTLANQATSRVHGPDQLVVQQNSRRLNNVYLIAHGTLEVYIGETRVAVLECGDLFGEQALLSGEPRNANVMTVTTTRLIAIPAELFVAMMSASDDARGRLETTWRNRILLRQVSDLSTLPTAIQNRVAPYLISMKRSAGKTLIEQGEVGDDVFVVADGILEVRTKTGTFLLGIGSIVGEMVALGTTATRSATVRTKTEVKLVKIPGAIFRELYDQVPWFRFRLDELLHQRGVDKPE